MLPELLSSSSSSSADASWSPPSSWSPASVLVPLGGAEEMLTELLLPSSSSSAAAAWLSPSTSLSASASRAAGGASAGPIKAAPATGREDDTLTIVVLYQPVTNPKEQGQLTDLNCASLLHHQGKELHISMDVPLSTEGRV